MLQFKIPGLSSDAKKKKRKASISKEVITVISVSFVYILLQNVAEWPKVAEAFKP